MADEKPREAQIGELPKIGAPYLPKKTGSTTSLGQKAEEIKTEIAVDAKRETDNACEPGNGTVDRQHEDFLVKQGFTVEGIRAIGVISNPNKNEFTVPFKGGTHTFAVNDEGEYACVSDWSFISLTDHSLKPEMEGVVLITTNPLMPFLGKQLGIRTVAISGYEWLEEKVALPLPEDVVLATKAGIVRKDLTKMVSGRQVVLGVEFGVHAQLGHCLKYHVKCDVNVANGKQLSPVNLCTGQLPDFLKKKTTRLRRLYVRYPYAEYDGVLLHYLYPVFYKYSDLFVPPLEKEEVKHTADKEGNQETTIVPKRLDGVPNCRIDHTEIVVPLESNYLQIAKCSESSSVSESLSGVTASRRQVAWNLIPSEYSVESFLGKDFTNVNAPALVELRNFFTAQKAMLSHNIKFSTGFKGWFGVQLEDGSKVFPAGYIAEDHVVLRPGMLPITTNGSKVVELGTSGSAKKWRQIMATLLKNSSFASVLGFGVSGLLLPFVKGAGESGFLNLYGDSGAGKTTLLQLLASAITAPYSTGDSGSYLMSFRVTENGFEGPLSGRNNSMMLFDEVGAADSQINWSSMVYMGANGVGKTRMNHDSSMRTTKRWATQIIGTGEASITSKMGAKNQSVRGGILFRLVEIGVESVPYFEHLNEQVRGESLGDYQAICDEYYPTAQSTAEVMQAMVKGLTENHGHAWWEMASLLFDDQNRQQFVDAYSEWKRHFTSKLNDREEKIVHRRSTHLASALTGLQLLLATMHEELNESEREAIISGAADWVEKYMWRAGLPDGKYTEKADAVERLLEKISTNPDRFYKFGEDFPSKNFSGFWGMVKNDRVFLFKSGLDAVCRELDEDSKRLRAALLGLDEGDRWIADQVRPGGSKNGIHGLWAPDGFAVLG